MHVCISKVKVSFLVNFLFHYNFPHKILFSEKLSFVCVLLTPYQLFNSREEKARKQLLIIHVKNKNNFYAPLKDISHFLKPA